jgi:hypothetical protein
MVIETSPTFLVRKPEQIKIPPYDDRVWVIFCQVNQFTQKSSLELSLGGTIHSNKTPYEVVSFVTDVEFNVKISFRTSQHFHGSHPDAK